MAIKNAPKGGTGFRASYSKPGAPSLQKALVRASIKNSAFRNLSKSNVSTIVNAIKPAEKAIRLKGGMSRWQVKSATKKLWNAYKTTKGADDAFSKQDVKDGKEIIGMYKKSVNDKKAGEKKVIPFRPYLNQEQAPKLGMSSVNEMNQHVGSIKSVVDRNLGSIKSENIHNVSSINSLTNPTHSTSVGMSSIERPTGLLGRMGGSLPSSNMPKLNPRIKF